MVHVLLSHLGMVEKESVHVLVPKKSKELKIAVYDAGGVGGTGPNSLDKVFAETKTHLRRVGAVDIRSSTLNQFDLVIFPGEVAVNRLLLSDQMAVNLLKNLSTVAAVMLVFVLAPI